MKMLLNDGAERVPIAVPVLWKWFTLLKTKLLRTRIDLINRIKALARVSDLCSLAQVSSA